MREREREKQHGNGENGDRSMSDIESFRSTLQSDDERDNVKTPAANLPPPPGMLLSGRVGGCDVEQGVVGERRSRETPIERGSRRRRREVMVKRTEFGVRVCEVIVCLISLSVMMSDKNRGWAGDSYYRYKEYRYCVAVTLIGSVYSGFQACVLAYDLITGNHVMFHHLRYHFDFAMDQILAYLLISASSSAATRVEDWVSNWGDDKFTEVATASVGMSFFAFAALALSSLISGYNLINHSTGA